MVASSLPKFAAGAKVAVGWRDGEESMSEGRRARPQPTPETQHFWDGTRAGELRLQRCNACGKVYFPPRPFCPACAARDVAVFAASGKGRLYSYVIHHRPVPGFTPPYAIAVVELDEGPRMMTNMIYDAFAHLPIYGLEDLGFVPKGEAGVFIAERNTAPGGKLPLNTNGGGLSYMHSGMYGMYALQESVRQMRGTAPAQIPGAKISVCHGVGGMFAASGTIIMSNEPT
jgi:uncharacterized OB-fold protein